MCQQKQIELLNEEIEDILTPLSSNKGLYEIIREPLAADNRALSVNNPRRQIWPLLPLMVSDAICGHYEQSIPAAAAFQFLTCAGDVFDDIEDADCPDSLSSKYGQAIAINTATTLTILAQTALARLKQRGVEESIIVQLMASIGSYYLQSCAGQHLDLSPESNEILSEDEYLQIIAMKSASQVACACSTGALLAKANKKLVGQFASFGHNLGMAEQIINDVRGIISGKDIIKQKLTLPAIFILTQTSGATHEQLKNAFDPKAKYSPDLESIRNSLFNSGAIYYCIIKSQYYRQMALEILSKTEKAGVQVRKLKTLWNT